MKTLSLEEMLQRLIGAASVSSVNPAWDMGNGNVIEHLEGWLNQLGFKTEVVPI
ncbi:MAG: acetylornithine deacetylase, partial [gamma proteobacterium symbiont of Ctena orbiculata]